MRKHFLLLAFIYVAFTSFAQSTCDSLHLFKEKLFGFSPRDLSDSSKKVKSLELDEFWNFAERNPEESFPCLKAMMESENKDLYFCFNVSLLLTKMDTKGDYLPVIMEGLKKANLNEISHLTYLTAALKLARKGMEVGELATKFISHPDPHTSPASIYLYNVMPLPAAEKLLMSTIQHGTATAKHNAILFLKILATDKGDSLIEDRIINEQVPDSTYEELEYLRNNYNLTCAAYMSRKKVLRYLEEIPSKVKNKTSGFANNNNLVCSACTQLKYEDVEKIRAARMRSLLEPTNEALLEYYALSKVLVTVRSKRN